MPDPTQLEREAEAANVDGHEHSFAAGSHSVRGETDAARRRLGLAAQFYSLSARNYAEAAVEHLTQSRDASPEERARERELAGKDCGNAAAEHWYSGRAYADAEQFEPAAEEMEGAAGSYVAEAKLREENGNPEDGYTLRRMANFRYLDAARYFMQAVAEERERVAELAAEGRLQAAAEGRSRAEALEVRAQAATAKAGDEAPKYHQGYQEAYI
jgi:hypothetical protein